MKRKPIARNFPSATWVLSKNFSSYSKTSMSQNLNGFPPVNNSNS